MANLCIYETRRLLLPIETAVEAVLQFDRDSGGTFYLGTILDARIESEAAPSLVITMRSHCSEAVEQRTFNVPKIAAAIINYCRDARIPLPRGGKKSLELAAEGFVFCIQTSAKMRSWHSNWQQPAQAAQAASQHVNGAPTNATAAA